jgi:hypothetical protein
MRTPVLGYARSACPDRAAVPTAEHLSPDPDVRASLVARIERTGASLHVMEP